jgi:hypothetical protein
MICAVRLYPSTPVIAFSFGVSQTALDESCVGQHGIYGAHDDAELSNGLQWFEFRHPEFVLECCLRDEGNPMAQQQCYCPKKSVVNVPIEAYVILRCCRFTKRMHESFLAFISAERWAAYGTCQDMGQCCFSHTPPDLVVRGAPTQRNPPDVRICRLRNQSRVGTRPPSTSTPHCPACWARR